MKISLIRLFRPGWHLNLVASALQRFSTAPPSDPGSANEDVPVVIEHDVGVQATDDDAQVFYSAEEEVEEMSKALELPDLDVEDSDCGYDFEFS